MRTRRIERRAYQERCVGSVFEHWNGGARSVLVVAPPGSGKTEIAILVIRGECADCQATACKELKPYPEIDPIEEWSAGATQGWEWP